MPNSCRSIIKKCLHKGAINQKEYEKLMRKMDETAERTGEWKYKMTDLYIQRTCSACGWSERMYHHNRNQDGLARNFCPNCGARMKGEEE